MDWKRTKEELLTTTTSRALAAIAVSHFIFFYYFFLNKYISGSPEVPLGYRSIYLSTCSCRLTSGFRTFYASFFFV